MESMDEVREDYGRAATETAEEAKSRVTAAAERVRLRSQEFWEDAADLIREHPGKSVGAALIAGMAIGALIGGQLGGDSLEEQAADSWEQAKSGLSNNLTQLRQLLDEAITRLRP